VNRAHHILCASGRWSRTVEHQTLPWALDGADLGDDVLEIGPGLGATTRVLAREPYRLTVLELEHSSADRLRREFAPEVEVIEADATAMPLPDARFSGVACFTMLHHVPTAEQQNAVLAEACRVLRPGGLFAGIDSLGGGLMFKLLHVGDTFVPLDPATLPSRLQAAGFGEVTVDGTDTKVRFRARKPAAR
jgi:ubiquinone/menaquinone biosynthesis C-methylase UbiE